MYNKKTGLKIKAVLLDYDGTLLDSVEDVYRGTCNVFRMSGIRAPTFIEFCETYQAPYEAYYRSHGIMASDEDIVRWYFEATRHEEQPFFPDVSQVMRALSEREILMGIISSHYQDRIVLRCREAGIYEHFRFIIGRVHHKAGHIRDFCANYRIAPQETLYIGDFTSDIRDAKEAGVVPVGITRGKATDKALLRAGADFCITHLNELLDLLER